MRRALVLALSLMLIPCATGRVQADDGDELEVDAIVVKMGSVACPEGMATSMLGGAAGGGMAVASGMNMLNNLDKLLAGPPPRGTADLARFMTAGVPVHLVSRLPLHTWYIARVQAVLRRQPDGSWAFDRGTVTYNNGSKSRIVKGGHAIVDDLQGQGTRALDKKTKITLVRTGSGDSERYTFRLDTSHEAEVRGKTSWQVDGGRLMNMEEKAGPGGKRKMSGHAVGQPIPAEETIRKLVQGFAYEVEDQDRTGRTEPEDDCRPDLTPGELKGGEVWTDATGTVNGIRYRISRPDRLQAKPQASAKAIERGGRVSLDGSRSTPSKSIKSYTWRFCGLRCPLPAVADPESLVEQRPQLDAQRTKSGSRVEVTLLCPVRATLEVSDGTQIARRTIPLAVVPRARDSNGHDWRTRVEDPTPEDTPVLYEEMGPLAMGHGGGRHMGKNRCAIAKCSSGHLLHPGPEPRQAIATKRVRDEGGPFHDWFYVGSADMKFARRLFRNLWLAPVSRPWGLKHSIADETEKRGHKAEFDLLVRTVDRHERLHTRLVLEALGKHDPVPQLEGLVFDNEDLLMVDAGTVLTQAETALGAATTDAKVKARLRAEGLTGPASISLPRCLEIVGSTCSKAEWSPDPWQIRSVADLGDESMAP